MKPDYKVNGKGVLPPKVTGAPPTGDFGDGMDAAAGNLEQIDGEGGMQHSQHPAKDQSKIMRYYR